MQWPAKSPDLNIIENRWGILSGTVYKTGRHFKRLEDLMEVVEKEWVTIRVDYIKKLYESIPKRLVQVLERGGKNFSKVFCLLFFVDCCGLITVWRPISISLPFSFAK